MRDPLRHHARAWPLLIAAAAVLVRLALIALKGTRAHFADTFEYDAAARSLLAGHGIGGAIPRAPLYPAFMALGYSIFGVGNFPAMRLLQLLPAVGVVLLTMWIATRIGGTLAGRLAGVAAALAPTLVYTSTMLYPTGLYTFIMLAIVALALEAQRGARAGVAAALGACIALAWFTDQIVAVPVAAVLAWIALAAPAPGARGARRPAVAALLAVLVAVALIVPVARYQRRTHATPTFFLTKAEFVLYVSRHDSSTVGGHAIRDTSREFTPLPAGAFLRREAGLLATRPADYLHDYLYELLHFFDPFPDRIQTANRFTGTAARQLVALYFLPVIPLAIAGLVLGAGRRRERLLLALVPLATAATYALFFTQTRYRVPTEPLLLVLAALGVERIARAARAGRSGDPALAPGAPPASR